MHPLAKQLHSFIIFRNLLSRSPLKELLKLLDTDEKDLASLNDAYAEFVFTPVKWPDFRPKQFVECLKEFQSRDRRFGGLENE